MIPIKTLAQKIVDNQVRCVAALYLIVFLVTTRAGVLLLRDAAPWEEWADQGQYLISARALFHGNLDAAHHWYPLIYPLMIAPFTWAPPIFATLVPDLACFLLAFYGFRSVARKFGFGAWVIIVTFLATTILYPRTGSNWFEPWTTTPSAAFIWLSLAIALGYLDESEAAKSDKRAIVFGALLALIPLCRPADIVVSAAIALCMVKPLLLDRRAWRTAGLIAVSGLTVLAAYIALHLAIFGLGPSVYMQLSTAYGTNFSWLGWKSYLILIEPLPWYPFGAGVLKVMPWIPLGVAGAVVALAEPPRRRQALLLLLPATASTMVMLAYLDFLPTGLWMFTNVHYFKWLMPMLGLFSCFFVNEARRRPMRSVIALLPILLVTSLRFEPVASAADAPARLVVFATQKAPFPQLYFARSIVKDRGGALRNILDYHQVPDGKGLIYAEALRRDFARDARWIHPGVGATWPVMAPDPGTTVPLPGHFIGTPVARYQPRLALGWPCWLPPYPCPTSLP